MPANDRKRILVAGATGTVGQAAVRQFEALGDWDVVALSRRTTDHSGSGRVRQINVDLSDAAGCRNALNACPPVTHVVYAALFEKPGLIAGWKDLEQMRTNLSYLENVIEPLAARGDLRHVSLLQGTKAYGVHIRPIAIPAKERWPRNDHANFYWLQEGYLRAKSQNFGFGFTIFRPQIVFGDAVGVAMNLLPVLGAYAAIMRELDRPFAYPGGPGYPLEATDARLLARALAWAADAPSADGETFNITNGDVFTWPNIWPAIAAAFGVEASDPAPLSLARFLPERADIWKGIAERHGLRTTSLVDLLGESHHYADFCLAHGASRVPAPVLVSTIKLRQAGFHDCIDTEAMFAELISSLQSRNWLPPA